MINQNINNEKGYVLVLLENSKYYMSIFIFMFQYISEKHEINL